MFNGLRYLGFCPTFFNILVLQRIGKTLRFRLASKNSLPYTSRLEEEMIMFREPFETVTNTGFANKLTS